MKLEDQVCSLDLAKRLKELGVKQESLAYWHIQRPPELIYDPNGWKDQHWWCSAFTVAELGEMLPSRIEKDGHPYLLHLTKSNDYMYTTQYLNWGRPGDKDVHVLEGWDIEKGAANSLAKMLIYLLENKLVTA